MRTPPPASGPPQVALLVVVAVAATLLAAGLAAARGGGDEEPRRAAELPPSAWYGFVTPPVPVPVGQRVIVVLDVPSLAERVARAGGRARETQHRRWTAAVFAAQRQLIADLGEKGIRVQPEYQYARALSGFSAALDARAVAVLERTPGVVGVYPVRVAYPAEAAGPGWARSRIGVRLPGATGRGVTIALLDTGVERTHRFLQGRVSPGIDVLSADGSPADAESRPGDPRDVERHGTQVAGILVGGEPDSPPGTEGLARGARVLPIRVAGWQPDARGGWTVYARTDQLIAGLERAVDPNADGDAHDAVRVAVVGVAQPYAGFADSPDAVAVAGALALDTLVVVPAGNDGPAGPRYGSIAGPGGSAAALTVGAAEHRASGRMAAVALRVGLDAAFDGVVPLAGEAAPDERLSVQLAAPLRAAGDGRPPADVTLADFFDDRGFSVVAGRAALVPAGATPERAAAAAANAGAAAVVLYGGRLPSVALDLGDAEGIPVVGVPEQAGRSIVDAMQRGAEARVTLAAAGTAATGGGVTPFSSRGLAFDGRLKPDIVAPGVAVRTSEPGETEDASPRYSSLSGASAAAAVAGAAAALLADVRPDLDAAALKGALVGAARPLAAEARTAQGAGLLDVGAASASELAAQPSTLAFHRSRTSVWREGQTFVVRNISTRSLRVSVRALVDGEPDGVSLRVYPARFRLKPRRGSRIYVDARAERGASGEVLSGVVEVRVGGRTALRVPWAAAPAAREQALLAAVALTKERFEPSDRAPSVLAFTAGRLVRSEGRYEVQAVSRLDVELRRVGAKKPLGLLARLRHLLPGWYAFGLTGRGPGGKVLRPGRYELRLVAYPTGVDPPTRHTVRFTVA